MLLQAVYFPFETHSLPRYSPAQQQGDSVSGPQVTYFLPVRAARIMALAQPTPLSTLIAPAGQLS